VKRLLDTNICIAILNRDECVRPHLSRHPSKELRMSAITLAELRFGVAGAADAKKAASNLRLLLGKVRAVPFDDAATERYGDLRHLLERRGSPIGPLEGGGSSRTTPASFDESRACKSRTGSAVRNPAAASARVAFSRSARWRAAIAA
jgi:tRNA(fMet)-specific endonuclease VapC